MDLVVLIYGPVIALLPCIDFLLYIFFCIFLTDKVIENLHKEGFFELSDQLRQVITVFGKIPLKGTRNISQFYKPWQEFLKLKIPKKKSKLFMLNLLWKLINIVMVVCLVLMLLPIVCLIIWLIVREVTRQ